ncbi:MAG: hypothetical protein IKM95_04010 [Bacteroidales bacterium]|jgi:hypothetical protein|nr:hypothetical protein [Bacteroidales bacterium]
MRPRRPHRILLTALLLLLVALPATAQKKVHSPRKAGIMSACLPGLGQIYNGKWWKTPIIYAGLGGIGYLAYDNYKDYRLYLTAYKIKTGDLEEGVVPSEQALILSEHYLDSQLQSYKESFRRNFELYCIILAAWYGLNIVDAIVDGHLYTYDISDDLSLNIDPAFNTIDSPGLCFHNKIPQTGLTLTLNF